MVSKKFKDSRLYYAIWNEWAHYEDRHSMILKIQDELEEHETEASLEEHGSIKETTAYALLEKERELISKFQKQLTGISRIAEETIMFIKK